MSEPGRRRIVLVDGYGQIYRAFYAIRGLADSGGRPTNALYGVARFLLTLERAWPHEFGAFVLDKGPPQERLDLLPSYKANRPPMPDDLRAQLPAIREWLEALGLPVIERQGAEADDVIAGVAAAGLGLELLVVSHDKDLGQLLVDAGVRLLVPGKQGAFEMIGPAEIEAKFGVPPACLGDYLALVGDASDNIPGVPGIGAKTAAALLRQFGSLEALLARAGELDRERLRVSLLASLDRLRDNGKLVALAPVLPGDWRGLETLRRRPPDWRRLLELSRRFEFKSLVKVCEGELANQRHPTLF